MQKRLLATTVLSLSMFVTALAQAGQTKAPSAGAAQKVEVTRGGSQPSQGPAENFTGSVRIDTRFQATDPGRVSGARVTFDPGARTAWHSHPLGQTLIVTAGIGRVQRWGDPVDEIRQGDVVWIPPGQKHWHGASPNAAMSHIAIVELRDGKSTDWMEKVSDAQYAALIQSQRPTSVGQQGQPGPAPQMMRDLAPKLADLTDNVFYDARDRDVADIGIHLDLDELGTMDQRSVLRTLRRRPRLKRLGDLREVVAAHDFSDIDETRRVALESQPAIQHFDIRGSCRLKRRVRVLVREREQLCSDGQSCAVHGRAYARGGP